MLRRIIGFVDWRFLIALALLVGVGAAVHGALAAGEERDRVIAAAAIERREASAERALILEHQKDMEAKYERLIHWLRTQDIKVPQEVLTGRTRVIVEDANDNDDGDSDDSDDNDDRRPTIRPPTTRPPANGGGGGSDDGDSKSGP